MSPPVGTWDNTSMSPWVLPATPAPAALTLGHGEVLWDRLAVGIIPTLQKWRRAAWGEPLSLGQTWSLGGDALVPLPRSLQHKGDRSLSCRSRGLQTQRADPKTGGRKPGCLGRAKPGCSLLSFRL